MTTYSNEKIMCSICSKESEYKVLVSTNSFGSPDLDTRFPEMKRSTMFAWVNRCPHCGYCSADISVSSAEDRTVVDSEEYQIQLRDDSFCEMANTFLCKAMIAEKENQYSDAAWSVICAAWSCDDEAGYEDAAKLCRIKAYELIGIALKKKQNLADREDVDIIIMVDLLRRSNRFEMASEIIAAHKDKTTDQNISRILAFQEKLVAEEDSGCYKISQALESDIK